MRTTTRAGLPDKSVPPPQLLVSIRNVAEFEAAYAELAPWIDVKEPTHGSLGRPDRDVANAIYQRFRELQRDSTPSGYQPKLSIALGELSQSTDDDLIAFAEGFGEEVYWKIALAGSDSENPWLDRVATLTSKVSVPEKWILVHYADAEKANAPTWDDVLQASKSIGSEFVLVDTWEKKGRSLLNICSVETLKHMAAHAHAMGLQIAMAGALRKEELPTLYEIGPYWIGFRSELCEERQRESSLSPERLRTVLQLFQACQFSPRTVSQHVIR